MAKQRIPQKEKLAAALARLLPEDVRNHLRNKKADASEVIGLFHFDHHPVPEALGGTTDWWNLDPINAEYHIKTKTPQDRKIIAKAHRFKRLSLTGSKKTEAQKKRAQKIPSRPFPKSQRKLPSRKFQR